jgi:hypothetical protein
LPIHEAGEDLTCGRKMAPVPAPVGLDIHTRG